MLELIDIKKRYGSKEVLHGISIKFENGIYGLIGPNGSGKSTIMNIMSDVLDMSSGKILYNGTDIKELDDRYREKIGFLPQNVGYYPNFTAKKTIEYFGYLRGVNKKEASRLGYFFFKHKGVILFFGDFFTVRSDKLISFTVNVDDFDSGIVFKQLTKFSDINVHTTGIEVVIVYPDSLKCIIALQNLVCMSTKQTQ